MGKCYSCFRATFTPDPQGGKTGLPLIPRIPKPPEVPGELPKPASTDNEIFPDTTNEDDPLIVKTVDLCLEENVTNHHTGDYEAVQSDPASLVVRRGSPIKFKIDFNRSYDKEKDVACLVFTVKDATAPSYAQGSMIFAPIVPSDDIVLPSDGWQTKLLSINENSVSVEVTPTAAAIVGQWILEIDTKVKKEREEEAKSLRHTVKQPIFVIFNPWCKQDSVYMSDPEWRKEYVLNDSGLIWRGTNNRLRPTVWNYAQFEDQVLECCCYLLSHFSKLSVVARADPVKVVRHISAVVNSPDDSGVIAGNWSGDYSGGQSPTTWGGSMAILQQFYKTKKPIKYGQCWVFSGVCTTVCRALGIPARSVTNFASAHDTHNSLTVDYFYDDDGEPIENLNIDSVWNFHVWNEVWMERPDLEPGGYGGWQAIDSTPQEESDGLYRCGPCSVAAIKRGEIQKSFDGPFVFAEVNADKVYWRYKGKYQPLKLIQKKTEAIGQFISTKAVGSYEREDITHDYKYRENTREEREVMLRALRQCRNSFSRYYLNDDFEDVQFDFQLLDDIVIGSPFSVKLSVKNKGQEGKTYNVKGMLRVGTVLYTGQLKSLVKKDKFDVKVEPDSEQVVVLDVSYEEYEKALVDQAAFNIAAKASVIETGFDYIAEDDFRVRKPDIKIEVEGETVQGQEFSVTATLTNPLNRALRKGLFVIEGPGLGQPVKLPIKGDILPKADVKVSCTMRPKTSGEKSIIAKFSSRELDDVDGYKVIEVKPASENNDVVNDVNSKPDVVSD